MANFTTVFLSSTAKDLQACRNAVVEAIAKLDGFKCVRMEDFVGEGAAPADVCRRRVAQSDVFVGLIGYLHGSRPDGLDLSFTQLEYEEARKRKKPLLLFIADEDFPMKGSLREPDESCQRQLRFRDQIPDLLT